MARLAMISNHTTSNHGNTNLNWGLREGSHEVAEGLVELLCEVSCRAFGILELGRHLVLRAVHRSMYYRGLNKNQYCFVGS